MRTARGQTSGRGVHTIGVIVPASNEEELLPYCLGALARARAACAGSGVTVRVVVALDTCRDGTAAVVAATPDVEGVIINAASVGAARAAAAEQLLVGVDEPHRLWLASTDADSVVPATWLQRMIELADAGADLVLGTVVPDARLAPEIMAAWARLHVLSDDHENVYGANLGIRASVYRRLGGFRALTTGEDVDLVERADADPTARIVRSARLAVRTSHRLVGRAELGFARYLRLLDTGVNDEGERAG